MTDRIEQLEARILALVERLADDDARIEALERQRLSDLAHLDEVNTARAEDHKDYTLAANKAFTRIKKLEATLREIAECGFGGHEAIKMVQGIARRALEGTKEP